MVPISPVNLPDLTSTFLSTHTSDLALSPPSMDVRRRLGTAPAAAAAAAAAALTEPYDLPICHTAERREGVLEQSERGMRARSRVLTTYFLFIYG
jgi:hypothetical protein